MAYLLAMLSISLFAALIYVSSYNNNIRRMNREEIDDPSKRRKRSEHRSQGVWQKPLFAYTIPPGTRTVKVYTYDGRPLKGVPLNTQFELEVMSGICSMQSIYTSMNWTGEGALFYQNKPIGFMTDAGQYPTILLSIAENHGSIYVYATIRGYDRHGGWPLISLKVPSITELRKLK